MEFIGKSPRGFHLTTKKVLYITQCTILSYSKCLSGFALVSVTLAVPVSPSYGLSCFEGLSQKSVSQRSHESGSASRKALIAAALTGVLGLAGTGVYMTEPNFPRAEYAQDATGNPIPKVPSHFSVSERAISFTDALEIHDGQQSFARVEQKLISFGKTFTLYVGKDDLISAKAHQRVISIGSKVDVYDQSGALIGMIQEQVLKSLIKISTVYSIFDRDGNLIAESGKLELFGTEMTLKTPSGQIVARLSRPYFNPIRDHWTVDTFNPDTSDTIDPRLAIMIAAFKTSADNDRAASSSSSSTSGRRRGH